jgi:hypothetical protein
VVVAEVAQRDRLQVAVAELAEESDRTAEAGLRLRVVVQLAWDIT